MRFDYTCGKCEAVWEESHLSDNRDKPLAEPCPNCGEEGHVSRLMANVSVATETATSIAKKIDGDFKNRMQDIKKGAGKFNNMPDF